MSAEELLGSNNVPPGDANFEDFGFLADVVDCAPLRLYVDGHQVLNRATFGRADGGWAVIPVLDGIGRTKWTLFACLQQY